MIRVSHLLALALTGVAATACTSPPLTNDGRHLHHVDQKFPIVVEPQVVTLAVQTDGGLAGLARGENDRVAAFAQRWKARGQGLLNVATSSDGSNGAAVAQLKKVLAANGVDKKSVQFTSYPPASGEGQSPITLSFVAYAATASQCGQNWSTNLAFEPRNTPWPEFGCATQNNIAAIIADPRDLIEPRTSDTADAQRRSVVITEKYQNGLRTQTEASTDGQDSGQSSKVTSE
ncbi:MAG: CpaD family pilus assembly protein [Micropepsaceae bacterium]